MKPKTPVSGQRAKSTVVSCKPSTRPLLVLVDGWLIPFRLFHTIPGLVDLRGWPVGEVEGAFNLLQQLLAIYDTAYIAVVFDAPGKNFRHDLYADYKANRRPQPDASTLHNEPLHNIVRALGIPLLQVEGVEADDVIGTLTTQATDAGMDTIIYTDDKDLAQLVSRSVRLADTKTGHWIDRAAVFAKFGVAPERIADLLALAGDPKDNIPGVPGVGRKTAAKWLMQYGSLDALVEHAGEIPGEVGRNLRDEIGQLTLARLLVTLMCDVPLPLKLKELVRVPTPAWISTTTICFDREKFMGESRYLAMLGREGDFYVALCPELDIASQGKSVKEATANLKEAVELFLKPPLPPSHRLVRARGRRRRATPS